MTVIEGKRAYYISAPLQVVESNTETAWAGAKQHIVIRPDLAWLVANLVTSDPAGNSNGHIFGLEDLQEHYRTVIGTPLDIGHQAQYVVGYNAAAELLYPEHEEAGERRWAYVEILGSFFKRPFADEYEDLMRAYRAGRSWVSMQCRPESLTCMAEGGCGLTYPYNGTQSDTYCDELNMPRSKKKLNKPFFIAAGLIIPPMRPGWRGADINEISALTRRHADEAEQIYDEVATMCSFLDANDVEELMAMLLAGAFGPVPDAPGGPVTPPTDGWMKKRKRHPVSGTTPAAAEAVESAAQTGVIVAIRPPQEVAEVLAALGDEPVDEMHCTLVFLGDAGEEGMLPSGHNFREVSAAVAAFAAGAPSLGEVSISGLGRFALDNGSEVTYASLDAPALPEFRTRLVAALEAAGVQVSRDHGLSPHLTVRYHAPGQGPTQMPDDLKWMVHDIELWWGDAFRVRYQLADGRVPFLEPA